jgi:hypothetical protein
MHILNDLDKEDPEITIEVYEDLMINVEEYKLNFNKINSAISEMKDPIFWL